MKNTPGFTTLTNSRRLINCRGQLLDFSTPKVMGILNVTPDSFFDGGKFTEEKAIFDRVAEMAGQGAAVIDIGAHSTRPGAEMIDEQTEASRLFPLLSGLTKEFPEVIFSIDTFRSAIAEKALDAGASVINDVSGGEMDNRIFDVAAKAQVPYILMHMKGLPPTMQDNPQYENVSAEVFSYLAGKINILRNKGVKDIIIDPGFGFGKNLEQNYQLLAGMQAFQFFNRPVMTGFSRKSIVCKLLKISPEHALNGTTALHMIALQNGASMLRVHDVKEAMQAIAIFSYYSAFLH